MVYVLEDGRILSDKSLIKDEIYVELSEYPDTIVTEDGKIGIIIGVENGTVKYEFRDKNLVDDIQTFIKATTLKSEPLSPTEQAILQTAINTEYMMSIMETTI